MSMAERAVRHPSSAGAHDEQGAGTSAASVHPALTQGSPQQIAARILELPEEQRAGALRMLGEKNPDLAQKVAAAIEEQQPGVLHALQNVDQSTASQAVGMGLLLLNGLFNR